MQQLVEHRTQVSQPVVERLPVRAGFQLPGPILGVVVSCQLAGYGVAQFLCQHVQQASAVLTISERMAMQHCPAIDQLGEMPPVLGLGRPCRVLDALLPHRGLEALGLALGLEPLAEALALDRLDIDEPEAIRELGDAHQTA